MAHRIARSTRGDDDLAVPVRQGLDSCLEKLHNFSRKLSKVLVEVEGLWKWLATVAGARVARAGGVELAGVR
jgi:hypothetical protein